MACLVASAGALAFAGSEACRDCHQEAYSDWQGSHHDLAMQVPSPQTVLGDFDDASFTYNGVTTRFYREGERYMVRTDGENGKLTDFPVEYVFGVYPLQQYLLPMSRGRLQALTVAWDSRPAGEGGQRWFHLYPGEAIDHEDPLHWTGPYHNWNTRCAECHSTDVRKNYDAATRSFDTTFREVNVGCEACHGPGEKHVELARAGTVASAPGGGFPTDLAQRGEWAFEETSPIARRREPLSSRAQVDSCGRCHARRGTLGDYHYGAELLDTHRLSLPRWPLYHHDGQIRDEVYVYGSFLQSAMQQAGVVCSNCHEPHSMQLRASGNGVCAQCHKPEVFDNEKHHHHPAGSSGADCANCHMPETTYMVVDPRRDHSMRIPRPDLSIVTGSPNACTACHTDRDANWALDSLRQWGITFRDTGSHPARAFHQFDKGDNRSVPALAELANDPDNAPIWRATAIEALGQVGGREALQAATALLYDDDPLLRASSVRALEFLPVQQRLQLLQPLLDDDVTAVRMEVADSLAGVPLDQLDREQAEALRATFDEYLAVQAMHADMPGVQLQTGVFLLNRGDLSGAEAAYREALFLNPQLVPAHLNLADLLRALDREDEARRQLLAALDVAPDNGNALHALGLLETRANNPEKALDYLGRAAAQETEGTRHRFVYAIALHDLGKPEMAITQLQKLSREVPADQDVLLALTNYSAELGRREQAAGYAGQLVKLAPGNRAYQQLYQRLSSGN
jgi:predicted CXXCH cytochrome family protein